MLKTRTKFPNLSSRSGATLVEFSIVAPVAMLIALGCLDLGRAFSDHATVAQAARQGAFVGTRGNHHTATQSQWETKIRNAVVNEMNSIPNFDETRMDLDIELIREDDVFFRVVVEVTYPFDAMFADIFPSFDLQINQKMVARRYQ